MILPLRVSFELIAVEVDLAQISRAVPPGLIVEVRGRRIAALPASRHGPGPHAFAELHHGDEAVAAGAVPLLGPRVGARSERGQRSPLRRGEADGNARSRVVERLHDVAGEALESIDIAPRRLPTSEVGREPVGRRRERLQEWLGGGLGDGVVEGYSGSCLLYTSD